MTTMNAKSALPIRASRRIQHGFSLIEILVGMAIGLIGVVVIFQMLTNWDASRRTTSAGSDAQIAGSVGMFTLEREFKVAGTGFGTVTAINTVSLGSVATSANVSLAPLLNCTVSAYDQRAPIPAFTFPLLPISITPNAINGGPVTITTLYGNSDFLSAGITYKSSTGTTKQLINRSGFQLGDVVVVTALETALAPIPCAMIEVTAVNDPDLLTIGHAQLGSYTTFYGQTQPSYYNDPAGAAAAISNGYLFNLGPNPALMQWNIQGGRRLVKANLLNRTAPAGEVADGIVNMQAQYGYDINGDNIISNGEWVSTLPTPTDWTKVRAVRVALLARSQQFEKNYISPPPAWAGGNFTMFNMDNSLGATSGGTNSDPNDWRTYRYRVYEKVIPLRNVIWPNT